MNTDYPFLSNVIFFLSCFDIGTKHFVKNRERTIVQN